MDNFYFDKSIMCPSDNFKPEYPDIYKIKYEICKKLKPNRIAEIGVRAGYSAWSFLQAMPNAYYIGFDANNGTHGGQNGKDGKWMKWAETILSNYNCELIELDTQSVNSLNIDNIDLFHIDGDHSINGVQHDLDLAFKSISDNGILLIDDIDYINSVKFGVDSWINKMGNLITNEFIKSPHGDLIIRKIK